MRARAFKRTVLIGLAVLSFATARVSAADPTSHTLDAKGVKIHYVVEGTGEPVLLIHGMLSSETINWKLTGVIDDLAKDHRVIALDLPGHGQSDKPEKDDAYGLQIVEDIILLLDQLQVKKAHAVGYSIGGMVAAKLVAAHPERVKSCLLGGMGWFREGSALQRVWGSMGGQKGGQLPQAFTRNVTKLALTEEELKRISLPVEVLVGDRDPVKQLYVAPLRRVRTDWPVVEVPDAGHINCIMKKQFRDEIGNWVRKNSK
jgi:pimeloyl-ACP methyl ester carboxylesterase